MDKRERIIHYMARIVQVFFVLVIVAVLYIMANGIGMIDGLAFGPGAYYYTDIPGWEKIFLSPDGIQFNSQHPVLFVAIFVGWSVLSWKLWVWLDKRWP